MSTDTEAVGETTTESLLAEWHRWYHIPLIGVAMVFMFVSRARNYEAFVTDDGRPMLAAVDSWYHWRTIEWTAENYPWTMPFEVYTSFPTGRYVGQFGTLFDQIIVTAAMVIGLGNPSTETLYLVSLLAVPAMAALVALPVFYLTRMLSGTFPALVAVGLLALFHGSFFVRSTAGQIQHHVAEVLFMAIAVLAMAVALRVAEREQPIWELVADRDFDALREPTKYSLLAGAALALYLWTWPPGVLLVGIFGSFFMLYLTVQYLRGVSPDHVAFVGVVSMAVPTVFMLAKLEVVTLTGTTSFGLQQPVLAGGVALGCVFMAWLAREWDVRALEPRYYPAAIVGIGIVGFLGLALVIPDLFDSIVTNVSRRLLPIDTGGGGATVAEARPPDNFAEHAFRETGLAFYAMLGGIAVLLARPYFGRELRAEHVLIIVWTLFLTSMAMTQLRFGYYFVLPAAIGSGIFAAEIFRLIDLSGEIDRIRSIETYQVIVVFLVVMMLFAPLVPPIADTTAWAQGERTAPSQDGQLWEESNHWLAENTPEVGDWGGADNSSELDYFGTYGYPEGGDFDYPVGAYGVLSWWDYGHLITVQAQRIPHSNPFQSNAASSSAFFTAESEEHGELVLDAAALGENPADMSVDELEDVIGDRESHEEIRYVMIDYGAASGKFPAITEWQGPSYDYFTTPTDWESGEFVNTDEATERFSDLPVENTMLSRLYFDNADGLEHYRLVHENSQQVQIVSYAVAEGGQVITLEDGSPYLRVNQNRHSPGIDREIQAVLGQDNYDLIELSNHIVPAVRTFERVEGATLTGTVDPADVDEDTSVLVYAHVESNLGEGFSYLQDAPVDEDGSFEVTIPYATDNELTVEDGYTNTSVVANDVIVGVGTVDEDPELADGMTFDQLFEDTPLYGETEVPESAVIFGEEVEVEVEEAGVVVETEE